MPALIEGVGKPTLIRFAEFFTAHISNSTIRQAYARAVRSFLAWYEQHGNQEIAAIQALHVPSYRGVSQQGGYSVPTLKQYLAAIPAASGMATTGPPACRPSGHSTFTSPECVCGAENAGVYEERRPGLQESAHPYAHPDEAVRRAVRALHTMGYFRTGEYVGKS